jgi:hypothetical protein
MRPWVKVFGGIAIIAVSFTMTTYILETRSTPATRDAQRIDDIRKIKEAVRSYRRVRNAFPTDLKLLVDGGFINSIPVDPVWSATEKKYQYYSDGVNNFGVLVWLEEAHGAVPAGKSCRTGQGTKESAMWGDTLDCPF